MLPLTVPVVSNNFLTQQQIRELNNIADSASWKLNGCSTTDVEGLPLFWNKSLEGLNAHNLFLKKTREVLQLEQGDGIIHRAIYLNGQSHGQCGWWHRDCDPSDKYYRFSLIYFFSKWPPEYGGHLLVKDPSTERVRSILPQYNMGVIIDATWQHLGMEPTIHCKTQRVSLAWKFDINK